MLITCCPPVKHSIPEKARGAAFFKEVFQRGLDAAHRSIFSLRRWNQPPILLLASLQQVPERSQIEIQVFRLQPKGGRDFTDLLLEFHQRPAHLFNLLLGERPALHSPPPLPFQQPAQQFDPPQHQLGQPLPNGFRRALQARQRTALGGVELPAQVSDHGFNLLRRDLAGRHRNQLEIKNAKFKIENLVQRAVFPVLAILRVHTGSLVSPACNFAFCILNFELISTNSDAGHGPLTSTATPSVISKFAARCWNSATWLPPTSAKRRSPAGVSRCFHSRATSCNAARACSAAASSVLSSAPRARKYSAPLGAPSFREAEG